MKNRLLILTGLIYLNTNTALANTCSVDDFSQAFATAISKNKVNPSQLAVGSKTVFDPRTRKWVNIPETTDDMLRESTALYNQAKAAGRTGNAEKGFIANTYRLSAQKNGLAGNFNQLKADYSASAKHYKELIGNKKTPPPPRDPKVEYPPRLYTDYVDMSVSAGKYSDALEVVTPQSLADFVGRSKGMMPELSKVRGDANAKFMSYFEAYNQRRFQIEAIKKYGDGNSAYSSFLREAEEHATALKRELEGLARGL